MRIQKTAKPPCPTKSPGLIGSFLSAIMGLEKTDGVFAQPKSGLGTGIVKALAKQLDSQVVTLSGPMGTTVSVTHATFAGREAPNQPVAA